MTKMPSRMSRAKFRQFLDSIIGSFVAIPLDGEFAFGRVAREGRLACYDLKSPGILPIDRIKQAPILFLVGLHFDAYVSDGWRFIGKAPLEPFLDQPVKFFRQDLFNGAIDIYLEGEFRPYAGEDLTKMERLSSWEAHHVEARLRNHFAGIPDPGTERLKVKPISEFPPSSPPKTKT